MNLEKRHKTNNNSGAHNNTQQHSYGSSQNGQTRNFNNNYNQNKSHNFSQNKNNSNNQNNRGNYNACNRCNRTHERVQRSVCSLDYGVRPRWKEDVGINEKHVSFKVDTGSDAEAVLPKRLFDVVAPEVELTPTQTVFRGFGGNIVKPLGVCKLRCTLNNQTEWIETTVVDTDDVPLLGFTAANKFKLIDIRKIRDYKTRQSLKNFLFNRKPQSLNST